MSSNTPSIVGADAADVARLTQALKSASLGLGWTLDLPVVITDPDDEPAEAEAGIDGARLWIRPNTLRLLEKPNTLAAFLAEEVAHAYLDSLGVPHAPPAAVIFQEAFAKWFMVRRARELLPALIRPGLVEHLPPYIEGDLRRQAHNLGALAGYAQGRVPTASERLTRELEGMPDDHPFSVYAKWLGLARHPNSPRERAERIAGTYRDAHERATKPKADDGGSESSSVGS